ncbi:tyrosine-type recombinase/integrase [Azotobacter beijerinckii]|uniref:tyrosine-type recombinase/integrase n=1 Tax=Azotobacter beijerinckii TaxID=170623 RepID=UPI001FCD8408|nr:tyrosine-type recombinase/integrase [Azotobacter beijerinckii]
MTGLSQRNGIWHIDKKVNGERIYESTGTGDRAEAERYLIHRLERLRQEKVYGVRRVRIWREAATRFLLEFKDQPSIQLSAQYLAQLDPFIGDIPLTHIDDDALEPFVSHKLDVDGVSNRTVNIALERVIRILNLCARKWRDDERRPWLDSVPMITKLEEKRASRKPYPLSWDEQSLLLAELPDHLRRMVLYKVNTGCREQEVCKLRWDWEITVPELGTSVFLIPASFGGRHEKAGVKNRDERLIVLNSVARSIIDQQRGMNPEWVFPYGVPTGPMHRMNDSAWRKARVRAAAKWKEIHKTDSHPGFASIRVHDLKHTFGRRLRAAGVTEEDRKALLGHKNGSITSHYSAAELDQLIEAANKVSATDSRAPALTILKRRNA